MDDADALEVVRLQSETGLLRDYPRSFVVLNGAAFWLEAVAAEKMLAILARPDGFP
ncbi:MAG: hypothetical protein JOZ41_18910, partial [Chloroflexi bacterium]|nr:hypothetical protein [Chloroflexota bacterium]